MREVSCKVLTLFREGAARHQLSWEDLTRGLSIPGEPSQWFDWNVYAELLARFERMTSREAIIELGRGSPVAEISSPLQRVAGVIVHLPYLYRFGASWMTPLVLRRVKIECQ